MHQLMVCQLDDGRVAHVAHSTRADGDFAPSTVPAGPLAERRGRAVPGAAWRCVHQVHGDTVIDVDLDGRVFPDGDALISSRSGVALAVHSGDCVPIGIVHKLGAIGSVHAGWKGLEAGVIQTAVARLRGRFGRGEIVAAVGPHIRATSYEFSTGDLARMVARFGPQVAATTESGSPALDLTAAVTSAAESAGIEVACYSPDCTAREGDRYWSHRARHEPGRITLVTWLEDS